MSYRRIYMPDHHRSDIAGFVGHHILVMEEKLGRPLVKGELVHHKDFHKPNNLPNNLQDMTRKEHQNIPAMQARFLVEKGLMDEFFEWWITNKYAVKSIMQEAEVELVKAQNQRERMQLKYARQKGVKYVSTVLQEDRNE